MRFLSLLSSSSARARYEFGLAPLSLSTTATLSGSHVISGAAVAASSPGSAVAIAMMVCTGGDGIGGDAAGGGRRASTVSNDGRRVISNGAWQA